MSGLLLPALGLALDWLVGEPRRWHPLIGFGRLAAALERRLNPAAPGGRTVTSPLFEKEGIGENLLVDKSPLPPLIQRGGLALPGGFAGIVALLLVVAPFVAAVAIASNLPYVGAPVELLALCFALGLASLSAHARAVCRPLRSGDVAAARRAVAMLVSRDTAQMNDTQLAAATVESVLENGNDAVFGVLFWFLLAGAPGAVLYRLVNTLDAMWGYRTPRYRDFGRAAARLDDALNLIPARLTALSYAVAGRFHPALDCWRLQAPAWDSPNAGPVMAAGAGALGLRLGGGACYHGQWRERPVLGQGRAPAAEDITRALGLVCRAVAVWLLGAALLWGVLWLV
ncbi:MAG TPA: cobalamin biosynthesis protein CobD [Gammaproteobacteria bacterium]|nr:cobalamin biosynthesis protein CobD [Gammaproteobacteria bacterium]